jgi:hypothetical protein
MSSQPPQHPPILRAAPGGREAADDGQGAAYGGGRVIASQTPCDNLHGAAQSMCYATLYGVSV